MKKGFTLVELLAVIVVLGILLLVAVPTVNDVTKNSKKKTLLNDAFTYINAAKSRVAMLDDKNTHFFKIEELVENKLSESHYGGVLSYVKDDKTLYYIYLRDYATGNLIGKHTSNNIEFITEEELKKERKVIDSVTNLNSDYFKGKVFNFSIIVDGNSISFIYPPGEDDRKIEYNIVDTLNKGDVVYVKNNNNECKEFITLSDNGKDILMLERGKVRQKKMDEIPSYFKDQTEYPILKYIVRMLTLNDLYAYFNVENLTELNSIKQEKIIELFRNVNNTTNVPRPAYWVSTGLIDCGNIENGNKFYYANTLKTNILIKNRITSQTSKSISLYLNVTLNTERKNVFSDSLCSENLTDRIVGGSGEQ